MSSFRKVNLRELTVLVAEALDLVYSKRQANLDKIVKEIVDDSHRQRRFLWFRRPPKPMTESDALAELRRYDSRWSVPGGMRFSMDLNKLHDLRDLCMAASLESGDEVFLSVEHAKVLRATRRAGYGSGN